MRAEAVIARHRPKLSPLARRPPDVEPVRVVHQSGVVAGPGDHAEHDAARRQW